MAEQIASLYAKISADTDGFEKGLSKAHSSLTSFGGLLSGIATGGVVVAGAAIAGLGAVIGTGISKAAGFEQSFADLAASMDATTQEIQPLKKLIMDLGLDPKLKVSTDEAASAVTNLVKNGLTMQQVLDGAARSTVLLANATGADFGMAADIATDVMQQFNISAAQMDSAVNGILGVTQASKFGIQGYKDAISMAGGVASSVGVSFEDFNAVIAGTAFNFSGGSDAGTSFKTFLQRLVPSTQEATDEMKKLGIITADGTNRFFDANGQMRSMTEVADILQDAFAGLSEEQRINSSSTLFGTDAMRTAFALAKVGGEEITNLKGVIGNTSAEEAAATRMDTLSGQWEIFKGVLEAATIKIGDAFLPAAKKIVEWAQEAADKYLPTVVAWFGRFGEWLVAMLPKIEVWIAKLADWGATLSDWAQHGELGMGLLGVAAEKMRDQLVAAYERIVGWVKTNLPGWVAKLREWGAAAGNWIVEVGWPTLYAKLGEWAGNLWTWLKTNFPLWVAQLREWGSAAGKWVFEVGWPALLDNLGKWFTQLWKWLGEQLPSFMLRLADWAVALGAWVINGIALLLDALAGGIDQVSHWLRGTGQDGVKGGVLSWVGPMWEWVQNELWPKLKPALEALIGAAAKLLLSLGGLLFDAVMALARGIINSFVGMIASLWDGFALWWEDLWWALMDIGKTVWDALKGVPKAIIDGFIQGMRDLWSGFTGWWHDLWQDLTDTVKYLFGIHSPSTVFAEIGANIMQGFSGGIRDNTQLAVEAVKGVYRAVSETELAAQKEIALRASQAGIAAAQRANVAAQVAQESYNWQEQQRIQREQERAAAWAASFNASQSQQQAWASAKGSIGLSAYSVQDQERGVWLLNALRDSAFAQSTAQGLNITVEQMHVGGTGNAAQDVISAIQFLHSTYSYWN